MSDRRPVELIELWIFVNGHWQPFENFDPSLPQFKRSRAPANYAFFEARRQGVRLMKAHPRIKGYYVRRDRGR